MARDIGIIGAGNVGRALGGAWRAAGHAVRYGVPDPSAARYAGLAGVGTPAEAAEAPVVVLATPWSATEAAILAAGGLAGRVVIDCTNPLGTGPAGLGLTLGHDTSGGERVQAWAPDARVFKTLHQVGFEVMARAREFTPPPVMYVAGDDAAAKPVVMELVAGIGFDAVDVGGLALARLLEPLAMLWIHQAVVLRRGRETALARAALPTSHARPD
jgi:predicted dinucleotide-binding enzyme